MTERFEKTGKDDGMGRTILIVAVVIVVGLGIAFAAGLFSIDSSGSLKAPTISAQGGEVPNVQVNTADIDVGSETRTVEVPTVSVTPSDEK